MADLARVRLAQGPSTLSDLSPWVAQGLDDPFTMAALRQRMAVKPLGGRTEGATTRTLDALGTDIYNAAARPSRIINELVGAPPGALTSGNIPAVDEAVPNVAFDLMGLGSFGASPASAATLGSTAIKPGIRAYHGSPHDFDRFDLSKIGTGEGAQAYGHGLYFAENPKVAESYKYTQQHPFGLKNPLVVPPKGHMYEVNINAKPEQFLDWDKPLVDQTESVLHRVEPILGDRFVEGNPYHRGQEIYSSILRESDFEPHKTTAILRNAGIPGIRYADQGSRGDMAAWRLRQDEADALKAKGSPYWEEAQKLADAIKSSQTSNYVLFDDKLVDILRKYGIAVPAGGVAASALTDQGPQ